MKIKRLSLHLKLATDGDETKLSESYLHTEANKILLSGLTGNNCLWWRLGIKLQLFDYIKSHSEQSAIRNKTKTGDFCLRFVVRPRGGSRACL